MTGFEAVLATITNRARAARGFQTCNGVTVMVNPGQTATLDLGDHPLHRAWVEAGDVSVVPLPDKEAKLMRKRMETERELADEAKAKALGGLPTARKANHPSAVEDVGHGL